MNYPPPFKTEGPMSTAEDREALDLIGWCWSAPASVRHVVSSSVYMDMRDRTVRQIAKLRPSGARIVYSPGVWDLMHSGHRAFLQRSKTLGEILIVGILGDDGAAAYKRRPVQSQEERRGNVADLRYVDLTVLQPGTDPSSVLLALDALGLKPDLLTHGSDWSELREGNETLAHLGIPLEILPYGPGSGTTGIINRIRAMEVADVA